MTSPPLPPRILARLAFGLAAAGLPIGGPSAAEAKPDWTGLDARIVAGDYEQAVVAADEIAAAVEPKRRDPDFLARSIEFVRALMRRGLAELRLGRLDAADATLQQAYRSFKDRDFQRLVSLEAKRANARVMSTLVQLELSWIELLNLRMSVILERLRLAGLGPAAVGPAADDTANLRVQVEEWLDDLKFLERTAKEAREAVAGRLEKGGATILASPYSRSLPGEFRPALVAGLTPLELSRLPLAEPVAAEPGGSLAAEPGNDRLRAAFEQFEAAAAALRQAIADAAPKGIAGLKPEPRIEAALMEAELLAAEGDALLEARRPEEGRQRLATAIERLEEAARLRKLPNPENHPDLFWPLLLSAQALLDETQIRLDANDAPAARVTAIEAGKLLDRAAELPVANDHPLRSRLAALQARLSEERESVGAAIPGTDAADAAARRMRETIDGTAAAGAEL